MISRCRPVELQISKKPLHERLHELSDFLVEASRTAIIIEPLHELHKKVLGVFFYFFISILFLIHFKIYLPFFYKLFYLAEQYFCLRDQHDKNISYFFFKCDLNSVRVGFLFLDLHYENILNYIKKIIYLSEWAFCFKAYIIKNFYN